MSDSNNTTVPKTVKVEDPEKFQKDLADKSDLKTSRDQATQMEKMLNTPPGGPKVKVNTPKEIRDNQESANADFRKEELRIANEGKAGTETDNGKHYKDPRIQPGDTNAPDAGLLPDGTRIAN